MAKNTYGTGCFVVLSLGDEHRASPGGLLTTICCDARGRAAYALEGSIFTAGSAVQWLRDEMGLIREAAETEALARSVADTRGVYVVPAFVGHVVRATLESLAFQTRDVIEVMNADSGVALTELRVDGGAAANDFLMQFQADVLGVPVDRPELVETTAAGAAYLAGLGVGLWKGPEALRGVRRRERVFEPKMPAAEREDRYAGWKRAVARVLSPAPSS
jgi:glycerol kinase